MTVKYFAYIRDFTKCKVCEEEYKPSVKELLHSLSDKYGDKFRDEALTPDGNDLGEKIIVLVNGRHVSHLDGVNTKLEKEDIVQVFPVVGGG